MAESTPMTSQSLGGHQVCSLTNEELDYLNTVGGMEHWYPERHRPTGISSWANWIKVHQIPHLGKGDVGSIVHRKQICPHSKSSTEVPQEPCRSLLWKRHDAQCLSSSTLGFLAATLQYLMVNTWSWLAIRSTITTGCASPQNIGRRQPQDPYIL